MFHLVYIFSALADELLFKKVSQFIKRPFSYSEKESQSNDALLHFVEFSNVRNSGRSPNVGFN